MELKKPDRQLKLEQVFYNERWTEYANTDRERARIELTSSAIPPECKRILDVGCGDGRLSKSIGKGRRCFLVGFDLSTVALSHYFGPRCCGSASQLPFPNRSFDLIVTTEVLEHLPEPLYDQTLKEIARAADNYILITVPNQENLNENLAVCAACGSRFHVWGHLRSYSIKLLEGLFAPFQLVRAFAFGDEVESYNRGLLWVRQRLAGGFTWEDRTVCYSCHATESLIPRWPFLVRACDGLNVRFWGPFSKHPSWLLGLYARRGP